MSSRRSDVAESALQDIAAHLSDQIGIYFMIQGNSCDERATNHHYNASYEGESSSEAESMLLTTVRVVGGRGDFDTARWRFRNIEKDNTSSIDGINTFNWRLSYDKIPSAAPVGVAEPIADESNVQVGRYERTKKNLFGAMFEYCVTKKLEDGECCGALCGLDRERGDPPTSYYLCENLHLLCNPCKQQWRIAFGNKGCPQCNNTTEYAFVITPN